MATTKTVPKASVVSFNAQQYLNRLTKQYPNDADLGAHIREYFHDLTMNNSHIVKVNDI